MTAVSTQLPNVSISATVHSCQKESISAARGDPDSCAYTVAEGEHKSCISVPTQLMLEVSGIVFTF